MAVHKKRLLRLRRRVIATAATVLLVLSALITVNNGTYLVGLPSWHTLFSWFGFQESSVPEDELRMTVLDVGNADCILLQSGEHSALIDAGENNDSGDILRALRLRGIERLDYVIATHADADHIGSMDEVIQQVEIGTFLSPASVFENRDATRVCQDLLDALEDYRVNTAVAEYGTVCAIGDAVLTVVSGKSPLDDSDDNDSSAVCRLTFGRHAFLLMGDAGTAAEKQLMKDGVPLDADVIKIGHHGSASSSDPEFVAAVRPAYAVITCGAGNSYGHPHKETLDTLAEYGVTVYRSDFHGDVVFTSDGLTLSVTSEQ